jgi:hypothetical protein
VDSAKDHSICQGGWTTCAACPMHPGCHTAATTPAAAVGCCCCCCCCYCRHGEGSAAVRLSSTHMRLPTPTHTFRAFTLPHITLFLHPTPIHLLTTLPTGPHQRGRGRGRQVQRPQAAAPPRPAGQLHQQAVRGRLRHPPRARAQPLAGADV